MKKLLALLLAIVMIFALCACGNNDDDDEDDDKKGSQVQDDDDKNTDDDDDDDDEDLDIEGRWIGSVDVGDVLDLVLDNMDEIPTSEDIPEDMLEAMVDIFDGMELEFGVKFANGEATFTLSPADLVEDLLDAMLENEDALYDYMMALMEAQLDAMGMDEDEFEDQMGMSLEEYVEESLKELEAEDLKASLGAELPDMDDLKGTLEYTLDGDELELVSEEGDGVRLTIDCDDDEITIKDAEAIGEVDDDVPVDAITELFEKITLTRE